MSCGEADPRWDEWLFEGILIRLFHEAAWFERVASSHRGNLNGGRGHNFLLTLPEDQMALYLPKSVHKSVPIINCKETIKQFGLHVKNQRSTLRSINSRIWSNVVPIKPPVNPNIDSTSKYWLYFTQNCLKREHCLLILSKLSCFMKCSIGIVFLSLCYLNVCDFVT